MATQTEDIAGLVQSVIRPLIDHEDDLVIDARETEDGSIFVEVRVNEEDAGKVIGRQGRVIKAIRTLARAAASNACIRPHASLIALYPPACAPVLPRASPRPKRRAGV